MECSRSGCLCFTVDMIHKYAGISLLIVIQTLAFGNHISDVFADFLDTSFLPGRVRIAVKDFGAKISPFLSPPIVLEIEIPPLSVKITGTVLKNLNTEFFCQIVKSFLTLVL